ncbi:MAG: tryptophan-rich sensory protein [Psychroflexus sp.]|nr:tryptophan-rich sensory protein [Psychroflexus sp.]MDN6310594.1 tryptophan-rich sensory protein [Psychroflexus sp.]
MMKTKQLALLNFLSVTLAIATSYFTQAFKLNGHTIGSLSKEPDYQNLFTPAPYAFAIWGLIYLALIVMTSYQIYQVFYKKSDLNFLKKTKYWLISANLLTSLWVVAWLYEYTGLSVIFMFLALFSLLRIIINTKMECWDASLKTITFSWWPICFYAGWLTVASIANTAAFLTKMGFRDVIFSEQNWTIIMIVIATLINVGMVYYRNMREYAAIGVLALFAIYIKHQNADETLAITALVCAIIVGLAISYHAFVNRRTLPGIRKFYE